MGMSERWVRELVERMEEVGDAVVVHGLSARASSRRIDADVERKAMEVSRPPDWQDFGPALACVPLPHTMPKTELSTLPTSGTFYFALTGGAPALALADRERLEHFHILCTSSYVRYPQLRQ